jgi:dTMP kinase
MRVNAQSRNYWWNEQSPSQWRHRVACSGRVINLHKSMAARGKFIVIEGIDGSGKRTQIDLLVRALGAKGVAVSQIGFPNYDGFFGKLVAQFLNGEFGALDAVDPHFSALLYAGDRLQAAPGIRRDLEAGRILLADRYIASNLAHQGARVPVEKRGELLAWLKQLEYEVYALPQEDLVIYLRVNADEAHRLVGEKGKRTYTGLRRDLLESDVAHLSAAAEVYDQLAQQSNWLTIQCHESDANTLRTPESIHEEILRAVDSRILAAQRVGS